MVEKTEVNWLEVINTLRNSVEATDSIPTEYLEHPDLDVRINAIRELSSYRASNKYNGTQPPDITIFESLLENQHPLLSFEALVCIYRIESKFPNSQVKYVDYWEHYLKSNSEFIKEMAENIIAQSNSQKAYFKPIIERFRISPNESDRILAGKMFWCGGLEIYEDPYPILKEMLTDESKDVRDQWRGHLDSIKSLSPLEVFQTFSSYSQEKYPEIHWDICDSFLYLHRKDLVKHITEVQKYLFNNMLNAKDDWIVESSFYTAAKSFPAINGEFSRTLLKALSSPNEKNRQQASFFSGLWLQTLCWYFFDPKERKYVLNLLDLLLEDDDSEVRRNAQLIKQKLGEYYLKQV